MGAGAGDASTPAPVAPADTEAVESAEIVEVEAVTPEAPGAANGQGPSTVPKAPGTDS